LPVAFEFIGPLSVALYHARQNDFIWVGCAILGLILLFPLQQAQQGLDLVGVFFAVSAGACWALILLQDRSHQAFQAIILFVWE
jgi:inner membrane transporter RhtA